MPLAATVLPCNKPVARMAARPRRGGHGRRSHRLVRRLVRRGARASEPNDPDAMALATADAARPPVGADGAAQGSRRPTASSSTPTSTAARATELAANPHAALAVPLEVAAPPGPHRRPGRAGQRRRGRRLFRQPQPRFAARRLGLGPVAAACRPRDLRARLRRHAARASKAATCRARRAGRASASSRGRSNSGPTAPHRLHERRLFDARRRRLERRPALPMSAVSATQQAVALDARRPAPRWPASPWRCSCSALKAWAAWSTGSMAMLGSLADTALDLIASLVTLAGVRIAALPADSDHRFGHGKAEALVALVQVVLIAVSARWHRLALGRAADRRAPRPARPSSASACRWSRWRRRFALIAYQRHVVARTGSVAIATDRVHYQSDLLLNGCGDRRAGARPVCSGWSAPTRCSGC